MRDDPFSKRLDALEQRLNDAKKKPESNPSGAGLAMRMGTELVAGVMVGAGFGYFIDHLIGSLPLFLIIFLFIGAAAGVKMMIETSNRSLRIQELAANPNEEE